MPAARCALEALARCAAQHPQREVVGRRGGRGSARRGRASAEEADAHDRDRQREDRRLLGGARDQVAGRSPATPTPNTTSAAGSRHGRARPAGAASPRGGAGGRRVMPRPPAGDDDPAVLEHARRGRRARASSGRCAISSTRRARRAAARSPRPRAPRLAGSRFAVGSSRITQRRVAEERAGERDPLHARRPRARGRPRRRPCRTPAAAPDEPVGAGQRAPPSTSSPRRRAGRRAGCCRATLPRKSDGRCGTQRRARATRRASHPGRSTPPTVTRPSSGAQEPQQERRDGAFSRRRSPRPAQPSRPGASSRLTPSQHRDARARVARPTPVEPHRRLARGRAAAGRRRRPPPARRSAPTAARPRPARRRWRGTAPPSWRQRQVQLGRQHEHGQRPPAKPSLRRRGGPRR